MKYALGAFPLVGIFIAGFQMLLFWMAGKLALPKSLYAAIACIVPLLVTGGIHADGYMDTVDALASCQPRERRLEILKDSHTGAFAVLWTVAYFLLCYGSWQMAEDGTAVAMIGAGYVLSRSFSGVAAVHFPAAANTGTLFTFTRATDRRAVRICLGITCFLAGTLELYLNLAVGLAVLVAIALLFWYYYHMSKKKFGGITGDLAGWFLQMCELVILLTVVLGFWLISN
jgi:adenosylcobinamide-GDP ribazoletransferase